MNNNGKLEPYLTDPLCSIEFFSSVEFQLRHSAVRVRLHMDLVGKAAGSSLVRTTVIHVSVLHKLQRQLFVVLDVRDNIPEMLVATDSQQS